MAGRNEEPVVLRRWKSKTTDSSRESRVLGLLKNIEVNLQKEENEVKHILSDLESNIRVSATQVTEKKSKIKDMKEKVLNRVAASKQNSAGDMKKEPIRQRRCNLNKLSKKEIAAPKKKIVKNQPKQEPPKLQPSELRQSFAEKKKEPISDANVVPPVVKPTSQEKEISEEVSQTSIGSSKVQQLRLFWDKFFLTETVPKKSGDFLDKSKFLCAAKTEMLDIQKKKSTRKISIPPSRVPISFRMVPSNKQQRRRKIHKENVFSDMNLVLSREVSTCVAKVAVTPSEVSLSTNSSEISSTMISLSDDEHQLENRPDERQIKEYLYKRLLVEEITCVEPLNRQIGCTKVIGFKLCVEIDKLLHCYQEGVAIRKEKAIFIEPTFVVRTRIEDSKTRLRKHCTLLPCYYVTIDEPHLALAGGDYPTNNKLLPDQNKNHNDATLDSGDTYRTAVAYERLLYCSCNKKPQNLKLTVSQEGKSLSSFLILTGFLTILIAASILFITKFN